MTTEATALPTWTILIPTLGERRSLFEGLMATLLPQVDQYDGRVRVRAWLNNGEPSLAEIRQGLIEATATDYASFIDDDDTVPDYFVREVMTALESRPDYVGFQVEYSANGQDRGLIDHSLRHGGWREEKNPYALLRDISHINPMRTDVAKRADFRVAKRGQTEDRPWVDQIRALGELVSEVYIARPMYRYRWDRRVSRWKTPNRIRQVGGRPVITSPHFQWHDRATALPGRLGVIVPTRGRPENIRKVIAAWDATNAWDHADLILAVDADDPQIEGYRQLLAVKSHWQIEYDLWQPMVPKLNDAAMEVVKRGGHFAIAFAGDDHLPRTPGWAAVYLAELGELGSGMVYGDDGYQGANLSTEWAVTSDAVRELRCMVPAPVDHLYCDNAMMDLFGGAGALRHLPEVRIEHMHPVAGKATTDAQYEKVNSRKQYAGDRHVYEAWKRGSLPGQIAALRALRNDFPEKLIPRPARKATRMPASSPRKIVQRSAPSSGIGPKSRFPFPRHFRRVIGATPDEIAFSLADFAAVVPAHQEIVELGVYQARTALIMAWGAAQGNGAHVTAVDAWDLPGNTYAPPFTDPATRQRAFYNVESLGYQDRVRLIRNFAAREGTHWDGLGVKVGLLFVDDDHSAEGVRAVFEAWSPRLADGAVIAFDDYGHPDWPGVKQAVDELVDEGLLAPLQIFHDRLAVTKLAKDWDEEPMAITAITSEGIEPAPVATNGDEFDGMELGELRSVARQRGVLNASKMKEPALLAALRALADRP